MDHLVFALGGDEHAIPTSAIREILAYVPPTRVPGMPAWIRGAISSRGSVLPVVDLAPRFGRPPSTPVKRSCIVVLELACGGEPLVLGIVVDSVARVAAIEPREIEPAPSFGGALRVDFIRGMVRSGAGFTIVLDLDRVFAPDEILAARAA